MSPLLEHLKPFITRARDDAHAVRCQESGDEWIYKPVAAVIDDVRLHRHLNSGPHLGCYLIKPGTNTTRLAAFDIDDHGGNVEWEKMSDAAKRLSTAASSFGLEPWPVRSGGGRGIHLFFRWDAEQPAAAVRELLRTVLESEGFEDGAGGVAEGKVEIFPKQDLVEGNGFGSLIAVPFGRESAPLDADMKPCETPRLWTSSKPVPAVEPREEKATSTETDVDQGAVRAALEHLPADDYADWIKFGMAIKQEFGDAGFDLWDQWSKTSDKHRDGETRRKWSTFKPRSGGRRVTVATIIWRARRAVWPDTFQKKLGLTGEQMAVVQEVAAFTPAQYQIDRKVFAKKLGGIDVRSLDRWVGEYREGLEKPPTPDPRRRIFFDPTDPKRMARLGEAALIEARLEVYQREGRLVRVVRLEAATQARLVRRDAGAVVLLAVNAVWLAAEFMSAAHWVGRRKDDEITVRVPREIAETYLEMVEEWKVPALRGTVMAPTLWRDGDEFRLLQTPGYDAASGLFFDPAGGTFPPIPENPTRDEARAALDKIIALLTGFPFVPDEEKAEWEPSDDEGKNSSSSRSVALSAVLTGLVRRGMASAPLHGFDSATRGTGKGYLARIISVIVTGRKAAAMPWVRNEEEQRKRLLAILLEGDPVILLDNATAPIGGATIDIVLAEATLKDRVLGKTASAAAPTNALILATGNNLEFEGDTTRRVIRCRMDARVERPEKREFKTDPLAEAQKKRGELVAAGLTVLLGYIKAGRPRTDVKRVAGFEDWTLIRGALAWLGEPDPADTMDKIAADDPEANDIAAVMAAWEECFGDGTIKPAEIAAAARKGREAAGTPEGRLFDALTGALKGAEINDRRVGRWFKKHDQRVLGGRRFARRGDEKHGRTIALLGKREQAAVKRAGVSQDESERDHLASMEGLFQQEDDGGGWPR